MCHHCPACRVLLHVLATFLFDLKQQQQQKHDQSNLWKSWLCLTVLVLGEESMLIGKAWQQTVEQEADRSHLQQQQEAEECIQSRAGL